MGTLAFFVFAVVVFVTPPRPRTADAVQPAVAADTTPARSAPRLGFPTRSWLPIEARRPEDLGLAVSLRTSQGGQDNMVYFEMIVPQPDAAVLASTDATVTDVRRGSHRPSTVILRSTNGHLVEYSNLEEINVEPGQTVGQGELIGRAGPTPTSGGSMLWYKIRTGARYFPVFRLESLTPDTGYGWALEVGPAGEYSIRQDGQTTLSPGERRGRPVRDTSRRGATPPDRYR